MNDTTILLAGATGNLGGRIAKALREQGADVRALVRHGTSQDRLKRLQESGIEVSAVDLLSASEVAPACTGISCVVSALQGMQGVIGEAQTVLLEAAIKAGVPRFIPSDYSIDFTRFPAGQNRNLDLRREFHKRLEATRIAATTIFNGAFAELLTGPMPLILFPLKRVLYWGNPDQRMDFTTMDDTAAFTARAALDPSTPRFLRIAGDQLSARELTVLVSEVTGERFKMFRAGSLGLARSAHTSRANPRTRGNNHLPGVARDAVHAQHVRRPREARPARQRPLSRYTLDDGTGSTFRAQVTR